VVTARVVIAAPGSGAGKTTVACGLIGALRARGLRVQSFKVGPDYIDPSYHALASGRPPRNLDAFLSGEELIEPLFLHGAQGAEVAVIEGVMGLFDGVSGAGELASTAHVSKLLRAPVLLVLDASKMARSVAAIVHGCATFDPDVRVAGIVLNRVGSDHHEQILREAIEDLGPPAPPVLGVLHRDERLAAPERHLGLIPASEIQKRAHAALDALAAVVSDRLDLDAILSLAHGAPALGGEPWSPDVGEDASEDSGEDVDGDSRARDTSEPARIAIAAGPAFSFHYQENLELLRAAGAELLAFDPLSDEQLPHGAGALLLAGGFPEVYGAELAANVPLREQIAKFAGARTHSPKDSVPTGRVGRPVLAECGGLLYLAEQLDGQPMCGVLPVRARMTNRLTLGYREARAHTRTPWLDPGEPVRGHEFHYSQVEPVHGAERAAWTLAARWPITARGHGTADRSERLEGFVAGGIQASFLHVHWAAHPHIARRFAAAATASATADGTPNGARASVA
jgi:cobyrinic acid a,c-diamide synthase